MKIYFKSATMLLSAIALCLPLSVVRAQSQSTAPAIKNLSVTGSFTCNHVGNHEANLQAIAERDRKDNEIISRGEALMKSGDLAGAINAFQDAIAFQSDNGFAYRRLAEALTAEGKFSDAAANYRKLLYKWPGKEWSTDQGSNPTVLMDFALVLIRIGQTDEALSTYNRALGFFNYEDGKQRMKVMLPELGNGPGQMRYTPQRLQAMAEVNRGIDMGNLCDEKEKEAHLRDAIRLWPDSPVPYFYLGEHLYAMNRDDAAQQAYRQAFSHSSGQQIEAVRNALKLLPGTPEHAAEVTRRKAAFTAAVLAKRNDAVLNPAAK